MIVYVNKARNKLNYKEEGINLSQYANWQMEEPFEAVNLKYTIVFYTNVHGHLVTTLTLWYKTEEDRKEDWDKIVQASKN